MSNQLEITDTLFQDVKAVLRNHDHQAQDDLVASQYLAALMGYAVGSQTLSPSKRLEFMQQLNEFAGYVMQESTLRSPSPSARESGGIWRPGDA